MNYETVVLIPTYNGKHLLHECLDSIKKQTYRHFKLVVVDDGSTDETAEYLHANFPEVDVLELPRNKGFAHTVNRGILYALKKYSPEFIAILNNDTRADEQWLEALVARAKTDPTIAAVTSNMLFYNHHEIINSQGGTIDWNGDGYDINFGIRREKGKKESGEVIGACFGASLIRSAVFPTVGFLDKKFDAYFEDLDWSWRAHILGYRIMFEKDAVIYHKHSASYQKMPYKKLYLCKKNALRAAIKNYETKNLARYITYILIGYWFALVGYFQKDKYQLSFGKKIIFVSIPFSAFFWNVVHLMDTLKERSRIQKMRKQNDGAILMLAAQDLTPVRMWINNLKVKFSPWRRFIPITERAKHKVLLPFFNFTKHRVVLPAAYKIKNINDQLMEQNLFGKISSKNLFTSAESETVDMYFRITFANLPFQLMFVEKDDLSKNESAFTVDACMLCLQLSFYRDPSIFQLILKKISDVARYLEHASIDWNKVLTIGIQTNASSQLYFYLRLIEEFGGIHPVGDPARACAPEGPVGRAISNGVKFPKKIIEDVKQNGSRIQNILLDKINLQKLLSGKPSFFLKLYSKMYLEPGLLKYGVTKMHSWYNDGFHKVHPVKNNPPHKPLEQVSAGVISNGVNIFGFIDSESGVGEASRTLIRAVDQAHIPYALMNSDRAPHRRKETQFSKKFGNINPYFINLIAMYGDMFGSELDRFGKEKFKHHYNIAYWAWELSSLPDSWTALLEKVNEVWTPSSFSAAAIREAKKNIPVTVIPHAIEIKKHPYPRARFGLPEKTFLFLFMFDFYSIFERKNPLAIIRAFKHAFAKNDGAALVIKCSNDNIDPENFRKLKREAEGHNIILIHKYLEREEIASLMNVCDAYVSLHRSEGFGLSIAEAMALRKPVIATYYSGNVDFMNETNSFPVPYTLVPIEHDYGPYKKGNMWAEPDEIEAAKSMRLVFDQQEIAARKGMFAERYIMEHVSPEHVALLIKKRIKKIFFEQI